MVQGQLEEASSFVGLQSQVKECKIRLHCVEGWDDDLHWTEEETRQGQMQELYLFDGWGSFSGIWLV